MKAMVLTGPGRPLELREVPVPHVGPNDVLVRVRACGIGLTLLKGFASGKVSAYPRIPGHEICGDVTAVGTEVQSVPVGQRVTCHYYLTCGVCRFCRDGRESLCIARGGSIGRDIDGGYAELVRLPARNVIAVPQGVDDVAAAIASDAVATPYHATHEARIRPGDSVLVIGAGGGVGVHVVQMARLRGGRVLAADITDAKLGLARDVGAAETIDARSEDIAERARALTGGRGVDAVIDMVGSAATLRASLDSLGMGGRWVLVGSQAQDGSVRPRIDLDPSALQSRAIEIHSSRYVNAAEIMRVLDLLADRRVRAVVTRTFALSEAEEAHEIIRRNAHTGRLALVMSPERN